MVTQSLIDYIKTQLTQGIQADAIKAALLTAGWQNEDIDSGFRAVEASTTILNLEVKPSVESQRLKPVGLSEEFAVPVNQPTKEPTADLNKAVAAEPVVAVVQTEQASLQKSIQQPREKLLEKKVKQKQFLKIVFNILFGVCLGIGLILGLQFVLERLFVNQPEPSPSPIIQPSLQGLSLADTPYKSEELGIEVFYPTGWARNLDIEKTAPGSKSVSFESDDLANVVVTIKTIAPLEKNISLEKVLERALAETKTSHPDFISLGQTKVSVSDLPAYVVDGSYSFQEGLGLKMKVLQMVLIDESREFYVSMILTAREGDWQNYRSIYEQIANSFKLTK